MLFSILMRSVKAVRKALFKVDIQERSIMIKRLNQLSVNLKYFNLNSLTLKPTQPFFSPIRLNTSLFAFAKKKEKLQLKMPSINLSKLNKEHDGFLLYQNQEGLKIKIISIAFLICFVSGFWTYTKIEDDEIKINYLIMGVFLAVPFIVFQMRTGKTLKRMVLDKTGENVIMTRFQLGGLTEQSTKARVQVLKGIGKAFVFGGNVIKGGGMYNMEERNYWFQSKYILEKQAFEEVTQGHRIKIQKFTSSW